MHFFIDGEEDFFFERYGCMYSVKYDAMYDKETGEWLEKVCNNKECEFCEGRPPKMMKGVLKVVKSEKDTSC